MCATCCICGSHPIECIVAHSHLARWCRLTQAMHMSVAGDGGDDPPATAGTFARCKQQDCPAGLLESGLLLICHDSHVLLRGSWMVHAHADFATACWCGPLTRLQYVDVQSAHHGCRAWAYM
jgi:hypothetical protein